MIAKTDMINVELIARLMVFRPDAGRRLPRGKLRDIWTLTTVVHATDTKPVARNVYGNSRWFYRGSCSFPSGQRLWSDAIAMAHFVKRMQTVIRRRLRHRIVGLRSDQGRRTEATASRFRGISLQRRVGRTEVA